jgi:3-keto-disaccharide hydrolase
MRNCFLWAVVCVALPVIGAERTLDFSNYPPDKTPPGFRSAVAGEGKPGDWKVIMDEVPPLLSPLSPRATSIARRAVLAQLAKDPTDEHFPMLMIDDENYGDFKFTTRFKIVDGMAEQMAGVAFRIQDEKNYYVVRASALGNNFRFYKVVNGERGPLIGPSVQIPRGVWQELTVECKGNQIHCLLDGKELIPTLTDTSFATGRIGFWTKSDSVSYFADSKLTYTPREVLAQRLVRDALKNYPRLLGLKIYAVKTPGKLPEVVASKDETNLGQPAENDEQDVIKRGTIYYGKGKESVTVIVPLRDKNGDPVAAAKIIMRTFRGQTEQNALSRAQPVVQEMQDRIQTLEELVQ